uniref:MIF4G_like_2 domain-containing protein n=1 Tax=Syphacia muris TaxID=451379 RepID=A0A0N5AB65_9BILA
MSAGSLQLVESIILGYGKGDPAAVSTYQKICSTIENIERWKPENITEFLDQFINISNLLDAKCMLLVEKLAGIKWYVVPTSVRKRYVNMLQKLAVQHVCHTETLLYSFTSNMLPAIRPVSGKNYSDETSSADALDNCLIVSAEEQNDIYEMAHEAVKFVIRCFPM